MASPEHLITPLITTFAVIVVAGGAKLLASVLYGKVLSLAGETVATKRTEEEKSTLSTLPLITVTDAVKVVESPISEVVEPGVKITVHSSGNGIGVGTGVGVGAAVGGGDVGVGVSSAPPQDSTQSS